MHCDSVIFIQPKLTFIEKLPNPQKLEKKIGKNIIYQNSKETEAA